MSHDRQFRIIRANKAYKDASGIPFNEIIGKTLMCSKALELQEAATVSLPLLDKIFSAKGYSIKGDDKNYLYSIHILDDITERKLLEEKLKQNLGHLHKTFNGTIQAISMMGEIRDPYTSGHEMRVAQLACAIAREIGMTEDQIEGIRCKCISSRYWENSCSNRDPQ